MIIAVLLTASVTSAERELKADSSEDQSIEALQKRVTQNPKDLELRYALGIAYNEQAMNDDEAALDQAIKIFQDIVKEDPNSVKAKAMLGSCTVMKAQHVSIFKKLDYVEDGYTILDQVVADKPNDPDLRLIRGVNAARSPGFLGRSDVAETDFEWLLADLKKTDNHYDDNYRRTIYFYVGDWFLEQRDSRCVELLMKASKTPGAPRLTDDIKKSLKKAKKRFPSTYAALEKE
ncbi:tetratricopeptide repeat protein [Cerasicoccus arenae]|nr:tetratricopeptide repeat protein [Cerasicoccus arenae]